jgi:uncharacterized protein YndB with AHSA1/START domain
MAVEATIDIAAPPERVFEILLDPRYYGYWVVGAREIRGWDEDWPAIGSRFHHTQGVPPLTIEDHSILEDMDPPHMFQLLAKARPAGTFRVKLLLEPNATGTHVKMIENPADALTKVVVAPPLHVALKGRNLVSLDRLKAIAEGRGPSPEEAASP